MKYKTRRSRGLKKVVSKVAVCGKSLAGQRKACAKFPVSLKKPVGWGRWSRRGVSGGEFWVVVGEETVHRAVTERLFVHQRP